MVGRKTGERTTYEGRILTERRLQKGISQMSMACIAEMDIRAYQRIESGEVHFSNIRMKFGLAICAVLGIDPFMIVFEQDCESLRRWLLK